MAEIKWMAPIPPGRGSKNNDLDVFISHNAKKDIVIKFANEGYNAIPHESIYLEVSHPDAYELHFRQYNKKPENRWAIKLQRRMTTKSIGFTPHASVRASFEKWVGKKYKVYKDVEHNTFYIKLDQGIKEEKDNGRSK